MSGKLEFDIPPVDKVTSEDQARDIAIEYQMYAGEHDLSYGEIVYFNNRLEDIASKFGLLDEFKENGVL
jgi:hypothetical protein